MTDDDRLTEIPQELREGLPSDLQNAEIVGTDVAAADESLRLHGPPGTGKSTQSALRIGTLATELDISPSEMTVVTYRRALADTIRRRLVDWGAVDEPEEVDPGSADESNPYRYWNTIHAAAARATGFIRSIDSDDPLSGMVVDHVERQFCNDLNIKWKPSKPWLETRWTVFKQLYDYGKSNLLDVGRWEYINGSELPDIHEDAGAEPLIEAFREEWGSTNFATVAERWEQFKEEHDCHDFYEMLEAALIGPLPASRVIVIDEYHDATPLMAAVSERWVEAADTAIVAGDPDQVCNAYAGASPRFFEDLNDRVNRDMPVVRLSRSWRCRDEHFDAAGIVLRSERSVPNLVTAGPGQIKRYTSSSFVDTGDGWETPAFDAPGSPGQLWRQYGPDIMFLTRTQKQGDGIAAVFDDAGVIYDSQPAVGGSWGDRLSLLRSLQLVEGMARGAGLEEYAEGEAVKRPEKYALSPQDAQLLIEHSHGRYLDVSREDWRQQMWRADRHNDDVPLTEIVDATTPKWWDRYTNGAASIEKLTRLSDRDKTAMSAAWNRYDSFDIDPANAGTRILTIHASKGSEASDVVVYDGVTGRISDQIVEDATTRENEARTWYVALTRASERLHIVRDGFEWCDSYLPEDLEQRAAKAAVARTDGGVSE